MVMDAVVERFIEQSPVTVMARLALQRALDPAWLDALFEQERQEQYKGELLFSTTVELMSVVAVGQRPSLHAAAKACKELPVSVQALYGKINRTEPALVRALVRSSAERLRPVMAPMQEGKSPLARNYRVKLVDGNHLAASDKRIKPLRGFRGAALPGHALVVYDPDLDMAVDLVPCEDGHAQERSLTAPLLEQAQAGDLWIGDRNFSTRALLAGWHERGCGFIVREHGASPHPQACDAPVRKGRIETGAVYEQQVTIADEAGQPLALRRIELHLDSPTEDGDTVIRLLTNVPKSRFTARKVARLYRRRWDIESLFQRLESVLCSEVASLGQPRAALLAFGVAVLAYNVLAVLQAAVRATHDLPAAGIELSSYYFAAEVKAHYAGMMVAIAVAAWRAYEALTAQQLGRMLMQIAAYADPVALRKHPRGPKPPNKKGYAPAAVARRHVSTARVIKEGRVN
jgi:IS4 transposase